MRQLFLAALFIASVAHAAPMPHTDYETVAASQTDQACGPTGGQGDVIERLVVIPGTTSPGAVSIEDGTGTNFTLFTGGASSVADLSPIVIELGMRSAIGAWEVTTGANVTAVCIGRFK
jgi:hypothetical protein